MPATAVKVIEFPDLRNFKRKKKITLKKPQNPMSRPLSFSDLSEQDQRESMEARKNDD